MTLNQLYCKDISYRHIIKDINCCLPQGEVIALMGPNGAGKSTLARTITGLNEPTSGEIQLVKNGKALPWSAVKRWQEVGLIGQHPRRQTIGATVAEELGFGLLNLGYKVKEAREVVGKLVIDMGLEKQINQSPATLSGGERQRLVIAAILALKPSFLILDEALTMLDERAQERCLKLLEDHRKEMGQLWITHDPELARKADRLLIMDKGRTMDMGHPDKVLSDFALCQKFSIRYDRTRYANSQPVSLWNIDERTERQSINEEARDDEKVEEVREGCVLNWEKAEYGSRLQVNQGIRPKEFIGVVGPSGAGKSTLLDSSIALVKPTKGRFFAFGEECSKKSVNRLRQKVRLMLQEPGEYQIGRDVYHEVFYLQSRKERKHNKAKNLTFLKAFGIIPEDVTKPLEHLSGGERQRVAFAAALESLPEVLLLDEPLLGLDAQARGSFQEMMRDLKGKLTIVYVTHDLSEIIEFVDRLWLIEEGRLKLDCPGNEWEKYVQYFKKAGVRIPNMKG